MCRGGLGGDGSVRRVGHVRAVWEGLGTKVTHPLHLCGEVERVRGVVILTVWGSSCMKVSGVCHGLQAGWWIYRNLVSGCTMCLYPVIERVQIQGAVHKDLELPHFHSYTK